MKKLSVILLIVVLLITSAFSHSGGTDGNGGHYGADGYHYHHGKPPHQHINGICPYDFEDTTNSRPSIKTKTEQKTSSYTESLPEKTETSTNEKENTKSYSSFSWLGLLGAVVAYAFVCLMFSIFGKMSEKRKKQKQLIKFNEEKEKYTALYGGKNILDLVNIPEDTEIGIDNLPKESSAHYNWGPKYTVYITRTGQKYHKKKSCAKGAFPVHIYNLRDRQPCRICKPELQNLDWYKEYVNITNIKKKYDIE